MTPIGSIQEGKQVLDLVTMPELVLQDLHGFDPGIIFTVQVSVRLFKAIQAFPAEIPASKPDLVDGPDLHGAALDEHIGWHIEAHPGHPAYEG